MSADEVFDFWRMCQKVDKRVTLAAAGQLARGLLAKKRAAKRRGPAH